MCVSVYVSPLRLQDKLRILVEKFKALKAHCDELEASQEEWKGKVGRLTELEAVHTSTAAALQSLQEEVCVTSSLALM